MPFLNDLGIWSLFTISLLTLLLGTQLVITVLEQLQKRQFGTVILGTLVTPMCTGFPNLMIGLFGQERLQGDLVLQLNMGNNLANTSLVIGLLLLLAGPLWVRPEKGKSKKAKRAFFDQTLAISFLWFGFFLCTFLVSDGWVSRFDGLWLVFLYLLYQFINFKRRGRVAKKFRLRIQTLLWMLVLLGCSVWLIQFSLEVLDSALQKLKTIENMARLGLFLGLLTVLPESFLMVRLAFKKGSLGLNGLVGDCLVSVPLVIGLSALLRPFQTTPFSTLQNPAALPFIFLLLTMTGITLLSFAKKEVPRKVGLFFVLLYAMVWFKT